MVLFLLREKSILSEKITKIVRELSLQNIEKNFQTKTTLVIPVYNEESVVGKTLEEIFAFDKNIVVIAVNDGSKDGSFGILKNLEKKYSGLLVLSHSQNLGQ